MTTDIKLLKTVSFANSSELFACNITAKLTKNPKGNLDSTYQNPTRTSLKTARNPPQK